MAIDDYVCARTGLSGLEIYEFCCLEAEGLLNERQREELVNDNLRGYGRTEEEITRYFAHHFRECSFCAGVYDQKRKAAVVADLLRQVL